VNRFALLVAGLAAAATVLATLSTPNPATLVASRSLPGIHLAYYRVLGRNSLYLSMPGLPSTVRMVTVDAYGLAPDGRIVSLGHYRAARGRPIVIPLDKLRPYAEEWAEKLHGHKAEPPVLLLTNIYTRDAVYFAPLSITIDPYLVANGQANLIKATILNLARITEAKKPILTLSKEGEPGATEFPPPWLPPTRPPYKYFPGLEWRLKGYTVIGTVDVPVAAIHVHGNPNTVYSIDIDTHLKASQSNQISLMLGATGVEYKYEQSINGETVKALSTDFIGFIYKLDSCAKFDASLSIGNGGWLPTPAYIYEPSLNGIVSDAVDAPPDTSDYVAGVGIEVKLVNAEYQLYSIYTGYWISRYFNTTLGQIALSQGGSCSYIKGWGEVALNWPTAAISLRTIPLSSATKTVDMSPAGRYFWKHEDYEYKDYFHIGVSVPLGELVDSPLANFMDLVVSYESESSASSYTVAKLMLNSNLADGKCHIFPKEYVSDYKVYYGDVEIPLKYYLLDVTVKRNGVGYCSP